MDTHDEECTFLKCSFAILDVVRYRLAKERLVQQ